MPTREFLVNASTRHSVFLQKYANGRAKEAQRLLGRLRREILGRLAQEPTEFRKARLHTLLVDIDQLSKNFLSELSSQVNVEAQLFAVQESEFAVKLMDKVTKADTSFILPSSNQLSAAVLDTPMDKALTGSKITIQDALNEFGKKKAKEVAQIVKDGSVLGDTTKEISDKVGTVINTLQRRQISSLVHTISSHTASMARLATYEANSDIVDKYEYVATLDNRTTLECAGYDGQIFTVGAGPLPPIHWSCRSTTIPVVPDEYTLAKGFKGTRPSVGAEGAKQVSGKTDYGKWLKTQPKPFIDDALGVERSKLFRSGKLKIGQFVNNSGETLTLKQLSRKYDLSLFD